MIRGLVIGKFLPVHKGHLALISFAARQCDEVIVSMSDADIDPIPVDLRLGWMKELTAQWSNVTVKVLKDDFDHPDLPLRQRTKTWSDVITKVYGQIDKVFSSEEYGEWFAKNLGAINVEFDRDRKLIPVSASLIRSDPFRYWEYILDAVRPYFVKRICFYGPESTGKSTLAIRMAERYNTLSVPEVAREMLTSNNFTVDDIIRIGKAQTQRVLDLTKVANKLLFCDTDVIVTQIYSKHYLGVVPDILFDLERQIKYDHYFFCDIDVPWIEDGLRDLGHLRSEMRELFMDELKERKINYTLLNGPFEHRSEIAMRVIDGMLL